MSRQTVMILCSALVPILYFTAGVQPVFPASLTNRATVSEYEYAIEKGTWIRKAVWERCSVIGLDQLPNPVADSQQHHFNLLDIKLAELAPEFTRYWEQMDGTNTVSTWIPWITSNGLATADWVTLPRMTVSTCLWKNAVGSNIAGTYTYTHSGDNIYRAGSEDYDERAAVINTMRNTDACDIPYVRELMAYSQSRSSNSYRGCISNVYNTGCENLICVTGEVYEAIAEKTFEQVQKWGVTFDLSEQAAVYSNANINCANLGGEPCGSVGEPRCADYTSLGCDNLALRAIQMNGGTASNAIAAVYPIRFSWSDWEPGFTAHTYLLEDYAITAASNPAELSNTLFEVCHSNTWWYVGNAAGTVADASGELWAVGAERHHVSAETICIESIYDFDEWAFIDVDSPEYFDCGSLCEENWIAWILVYGGYEYKAHGLSYVEWHFDYMTENAP